MSYNEYDNYLQSIECGEYEYYARQNYLDSLVGAEKFQLHAVEVALDYLESAEFKRSGMTAEDFFSDLRDKLDKKQNEVTQLGVLNEDDLGLPF